ncbi:MAG: NADH-quinone oxidoreductase subunit A [Fimbriiglobus sp.]|jgi:NADH-quinone oxidoreductase subunit A|nr:NADH-quinone oxidoreductase subunit A [Fimbriiglobus sp.]
MTTLVATIAVFVSVGAVFLLANLFLGKLVRPNRPSPEKGDIYECGEKPVGTAWVQFDLRFYVVALLFVIFDVEIAFFFPWAVVFGQLTRPEAGESAATFARFAFFELMVFFGILLVGFAYLWKRGDLEWVRSVAGQTPVSRDSGASTAETPSPSIRG